MKRWCLLTVFVALFTGCHAVPTTHSESHSKSENASSDFSPGTPNGEASPFDS